MKYKFSTPAIVIGSGKTALGIIRALGNKKIPVTSLYYDKKDVACASRYIGQSFITPHPGIDEIKFLNFLLNFENQKGSLIIPTDDESLKQVVLNREILSQKYSLPVQSWEKTERILNSQKVFEMAEKTGILSPRTYTPSEYDQALGFIEETNLPIIMKGTPGKEFEKVFRCNAILIESANHLKNMFTIAQKFGIKILLQEYIPGESNIIYDSYSVNGDPVLQFTAEKLRSSAPLYSNARVLRSKYFPEVYEIGKSLLKILNLSGFYSMTFKKDSRSLVYKILNITARHSISTSLSARCGINFPYYNYTHAVMGIVPEEQYSFKENIYWIDAGRDIPLSIKTIYRNNSKIKDFITPYISKKVLSIPSFRDPMPLVKRVKDIAVSVPNIVFTNLREKIAGMV